jgi:hypothetical protein
LHGNFQNGKFQATNDLRKKIKKTEMTSKSIVALQKLQHTINEQSAGTWTDYFSVHHRLRPATALPGATVALHLQIQVLRDFHAQALLVDVVQGSFGSDTECNGSERARGVVSSRRQVVFGLAESCWHDFDDDQGEKLIAFKRRGGVYKHTVMIDIDWQCPPTLSWSRTLFANAKSVDSANCGCRVFVSFVRRGVALRRKSIDVPVLRWDCIAMEREAALFDLAAARHCWRHRSLAIGVDKRDLPRVHLPTFSVALASESNCLAAGDRFMIAIASHHVRFESCRQELAGAAAPVRRSVAVTQAAGVSPSSSSLSSSLSPVRRAACGLSRCDGAAADGGLGALLESSGIDQDVARAMIADGLTAADLHALKLVQLMVYGLSKFQATAALRFLAAELEGLEIGAVPAAADDASLWSQLADRHEMPADVLHWVEGVRVEFVRHLTIRTGAADGAVTRRDKVIAAEQYSDLQRVASYDMDEIAPFALVELLKGNVDVGFLALRVLASCDPSTPMAPSSPLPPFFVEYSVRVTLCSADDQMRIAPPLPVVIDLPVEVYSARQDIASARRQSLGEHVSAAAPPLRADSLQMLCWRAIVAHHIDAQPLPSLIVDNLRHRCSVYRDESEDEEESEDFEEHRGIEVVDDGHQLAAAAPLDEGLVNIVVDDDYLQLQDLMGAN